MSVPSGVAFLKFPPCAECPPDLHHHLLAVFSYNAVGPKCFFVVSAHTSPQHDPVFHAHPIYRRRHNGDASTPLPPSHRVSHHFLSNEAFALPLTLRPPDVVFAGIAMCFSQDGKRRSDDDSDQPSPSGEIEKVMHAAYTAPGTEFVVVALSNQIAKVSKSFVESVPYEDWVRSATERGADGSRVCRHGSVTLKRLWGNDNDQVVQSLPLITVAHVQNICAAAIRAFPAMSAVYDTSHRGLSVNDVFKLNYGTRTPSAAPPSSPATPAAAARVGGAVRKKPLNMQEVVASMSAETRALCEASVAEAADMLPPSDSEDEGMDDEQEDVEHSDRPGSAAAAEVAAEVATEAAAEADHDGEEITDGEAEMPRKRPKSVPAATTPRGTSTPGRGRGGATRGRGRSPNPRAGKTMSATKSAAGKRGRPVAAHKAPAAAPVPSSPHRHNGPRSLEAATANFAAAMAESMRAEQNAQLNDIKAQLARISDMLSGDYIRVIVGDEIKARLSNVRINLT